MDVRCEKCQTEYELDEARLKPGGVTVKCTNCGHMFRIRKRTITNVGTGARETGPPPRPRANSSKPLASPPAMPPPPPISQPMPRDSFLDDEARQFGQDEAPTTPDRQWLIRLDSGEQKSCRELATLQQWIIAGVVTRESLISRTGKTWKRLGDVADLGQYFTIADEARANRDRMKPPRSGPIASTKDVPGTLPGYGAAQAAGGTILPDDDDGGEARTTRAYKNHGPGTTPPPVPQRGAARTPPTGAQTAASQAEPGAAIAPPPLPRRPATTPPPPPAKRLAAAQQPPAIPQGNRATASWATDGVAPEGPSQKARPFVGKLSAAPDEPAFAGRVRMAPGDDAFQSGQVRTVDDDDDVLPVRRGSRAGMVVLISALLVMAGAAAVIYVLVIRTSDEPAVQPVNDAAVVAMAPDAAPIDAVALDAAVVDPVSPVESARGELGADIEGRLRSAAQALDGKPDAASQALRAVMLAQLAQDLIDRASVTADKAAADRLRQESRQIVLEAATGAQRALRAAGDDAGANIAMASVLRLQGKPARDIKRYVDMARAKGDKDWARDLALTEAAVLARDGKLDDAKAAFAAIDQGDGKLETSNDVRARFHHALVLTAQNKAADAKPLVESILALQPDHLAARALSEKLATLVAQTDPLPPEDGNAGKDTAKDTGKDVRPVRPATPPVAAPEPGGDSYDRLLARANKLAENNCGQAMPLYAKALEQKPNGVEGLTGMGYCHLDAKEYASAFSKFRAALAVSPRYEGALRGVAEAYQQMGRKEQAIEAYKAYLDVYPDSVAARRQLERLGGAAPPAGSPAPPAPAPPPEQPAPPAPAPSEPPPGGGSGSG